MLLSKNTTYTYQFFSFYSVPDSMSSPFYYNGSCNGEDPQFIVTKTYKIIIIVLFL